MAVLSQSILFAIGCHLVYEMPLGALIPYLSSIVQGPVLKRQVKADEKKTDAKPDGKPDGHLSTTLWRNLFPVYENTKSVDDSNKIGPSFLYFLMSNVEKLVHRETM